MNAVRQKSNIKEASPLQQLISLQQKDNNYYDISQKTIERGNFVYFPSDDITTVFFVIKGRIKTGAYSPDGKEIINSVLLSEGLFGEMGLMSACERGEFAQAMEKTEILIIKLPKLRELMANDSHFALLITQKLGAKLHKAQKRLESQVFRKAKDRVIEFLRDLGTENGQKVGFELLVKQFFTHQEIAGLTGTSRQTVTTILNELRAENLIYFNRRRLLIRDIKQLNRMIA